MEHDETIIMPKNYTTLTEEEMTYLDGGVRFEAKWWGYPTASVTGVWSQ